MLRGYEQGTMENIQGLHCHVPPVGKVPDLISGMPDMLLDVGVEGMNMPTRMQRWRICAPPDDHEHRRKLEKLRQDGDPYYVDDGLQQWRDREWYRRLNGYWFMNFGKPVYITGLHYFYLCYWHIDGGLPDYREADRKYFYFLQVCSEDPDCLGMVEVTKRRQGKTRRASCFLYERASRMANHMAGIQSKTERDASENVFKKAIISAWRLMPDFFRPIYDLSQGDSPKSSLRFYSTSRKGKVLLDDNQDEDQALNSMIDYRSSNVYAYDGEKLGSLLVDECGKTEEIDVWERHQVTRMCLEVDGRFIGKAIYTTTVEDLRTMKGKFLHIWNASDQMDRNENNRTVSGLYRYFTPSDQTMYYDEYGMPDQDQARKYIFNERGALELRGEFDALNAFIRKHPLTVEEAFRTDNADSMFSAFKLNERLDILQFSDNLTVRGNLRWENGTRDGKVVFSEDPTGRWEFTWLPESELHTNAVKRTGLVLTPSNNAIFAIGIDPYDHNYTQDKYRSKGAILVYGKANPLDPDMSERFVCMYHDRPSRVEKFYEDAILTCMWFGCEALVEDNKTGLINYFEARGYHKFLAWMPNAIKPGISASSSSHQAITERWEDYIDKHIDKVGYLDMVKELLSFDIKNTRKFDIVMAGGYALLLAYAKLLKQEMAVRKSTGAVYFKPKNS